MPNYSPLSEADAQSLDELFNRDPLDLTDNDLEQMVTLFRKQRAQWQQDQATKPPRRKGPSTPVDPNISLEDLGL